MMLQKIACIPCIPLRATWSTHMLYGQSTSCFMLLAHMTWACCMMWDVTGLPACCNDCMGVLQCLHGPPHGQGQRCMFWPMLRSYAITCLPQVLPQLLHYMDVDAEDPDSPDWGCIAVYSCSNSCSQSNGDDDSSYIEEFAWVQPP